MTRAGALCLLLSLTDPQQPESVIWPRRHRVTTRPSNSLTDRANVAGLERPKMASVTDRAGSQLPDIRMADRP